MDFFIPENLGFCRLGAESHTFVKTIFTKAEFSDYNPHQERRGEEMRDD